MLLETDYGVLGSYDATTLKSLNFNALPVIAIADAGIKTNPYDSEIQGTGFDGVNLDTLTGGRPISRRSEDGAFAKGTYGRVNWYLDETGTAASALAF